MEDDEFRALQEEAALISEMADHPGWTLLVQRAHRLFLIKQKEIVLGNAESYEDYCARAAWLAGASSMLDIPGDVKKSLITEVDSRAESAS